MRCQRGYLSSLYDDHVKCVEKLIARDRNSWDYVLQHYVPFLRLLAMQVGLRKDEAAESVQATLASLLEDDARDLRNYKGLASFKTYIACITHRDSIDFLRQKKREKCKVERIKYAYIEDGVDGMDEKLNMKFDMEILVSNLEGKDKLLAKLLYYDELTNEEVAPIFKVEPSTIDVWHFRLREKLRKINRMLSRQNGYKEEQGGV